MNPPDSLAATAIAALDAARDRFLEAYEPVPEAALAHLKPGDDYSLGGLVVHVNAALRRYADVLDEIWNAGGATVDAGEIDARLIAANLRAGEGLDGAGRQRELETLRALHQRVTAGLREIPDSGWDTKTPVLYHGGGSPCWSRAPAPRSACPIRP